MFYWRRNSAEPMDSNQVPSKYSITGVIQEYHTLKFSYSLDVYKIKVANMLIIDSFDISLSDSKVTFNNIDMY